MKRFVFALLFLVSLGGQGQAMTGLELVIFPGGLSWPVFVAQDEGFFAKEDLAVAVTETPGSVAQLNGVLAGDFDIALTPFDNVVAYQEGQAGVSLSSSPDLFVFMGGIDSALRLIARPEIKSYADLRDKTLGVDSLSAGYTLLLYKLLDQHGLPPGTYRLEQLGGTASRVKALADGRIAATMVSAPQDIPLVENGFTMLGDVRTQLGRYQALSGVARRSWAAHHPSELIRFIRAYVAANDWLADPANRSAATRIYRHHLPNASQADAEKAWDAMLSRNEGFQRHARFDGSGAQMALSVREQYGTSRRKLPAWEQYVDESFYDKAISGMH